MRFNKFSRLIALPLLKVINWKYILFFFCNFRKVLLCNGTRNIYVLYGFQEEMIKEGRGGAFFYIVYPI